MPRSFSHLSSLISYSMRTIGPRRIAASALRWFLDGRARQVDTGFDARFGTNTNRAVTPAEAGIPSERKRSATLYVPTLDGDFDAMLEALPWPEELSRRSTFIDLGSGKGRVVCLAAMRSFCEVVGVELSSSLHQVANDNVARVRAAGALASPTRLVNEDATEYEVPGGPIIVFMYHPFTEPVARVVVERLCCSLRDNPRPAAVLYGHPTLQPPLPRTVFEADGTLRRVAHGGRSTRHFRVEWSVFSNRREQGQAT